VPSQVACHGSVVAFFTTADRHTIDKYIRELKILVPECLLHPCLGSRHELVSLLPVEAFAYICPFTAWERFAVDCKLIATCLGSGVVVEHRQVSLAVHAIQEL